MHACIRTKLVRNPSAEGSSLPSAALETAAESYERFRGSGSSETTLSSFRFLLSNACTESIEVQ